MLDHLTHEVRIYDRATDLFKPVWTSTWDPTDRPGWLMPPSGRWLIELRDYLPNRGATAVRIHRPWAQPLDLSLDDIRQDLRPPKDSPQTPIFDSQHPPILMG